MVEDSASGPVPGQSSRARADSVHVPAMSRAALLALVLTVAPAVALAGEIIPGPVTADVVSVYDGDTLTMDAHPWPQITVRTSVRVDGIDAPEIRGKRDSEKALAREVRTEIELVLALDASTSVSAEEFELQRRGLADAFRHPDVMAAIRAAGDLGIAVALVQWSGPRLQRTSIDWTLVRDEAGAAGLAAAIDNGKRLLRGGTSLGGAIRFSLARIEDNRFDGRRKVIDVSGDGFTGHSPRRERDRALARGVTINGLAIENEKPRLGEYYAAHVIGGTGAFVMTVASFEDFAVAIRDKLIREIAGMVVAGEAGVRRR